MPYIAHRKTVLKLYSKSEPDEIIITILLEHDKMFQIKFMCWVVSTNFPLKEKKLALFIWKKKKKDWSDK